MGKKTSKDEGTNQVAAVGTYTASQLPHKPSLVDAISSATAEDLEALRARIAELEQARDEKLAAINRDIDGLRAAARIIDVRLNGAPQRKPRQAKPQPDPNATPAEQRSAEDGDSLRCKIYDAIADQGPMTITQLSARLRMPKAPIAMAVAKSNWFRRDGDEVTNA